MRKSGYLTRFGLLSSPDNGRTANGLHLSGNRSVWTCGLFCSFFQKHPRVLENVVQDGVDGLDEETIKILLAFHVCLVGEGRQRPYEVVSGRNLVLEEASEGLIDSGFVELIPRICAIDLDPNVVRLGTSCRKHHCLSAKKSRLYLLNQLLDCKGALLPLTQRSPPFQLFFRHVA